MDMERLAEIFEAVKVLPLRPDDYILFRTQQRIPHEYHAEVREALELVFGKRNKILVLECGDDIEIVRPEAA